MNHRTAILLAGAAVVCLGMLAACVSRSEAPPPRASDADSSAGCSACTLRHRALGKSEEAREREGAALRELFENSGAGSEQ